MLGGGLLICMPLLICSRGASFFKKELLGLYLKIALFIVYGKYVLRYISLSYLSVAKLSFIMACSPFVAALFCYLSYKERLTRLQWISLCVGFAGVFPLLLITGTGELNLHEFMKVSWPELAALGSIIAHVYGMMLVRKALRQHAVTPLALNGITACLGGLMALVTAAFVEPMPTVESLVYISGGVCVLIVLSNIVCHTCYMYLINRYSVTFITFTDFLSAFFSSFYGWFFLHEPFSWHYVVSAVVLVSALFLFYKQELQTLTKDTV